MGGSPLHIASKSMQKTARPGNSRRAIFHSPAVFKRQWLVILCYYFTFYMTLNVVQLPNKLTSFITLSQVSHVLQGEAPPDGAAEPRRAGRSPRRRPHPVQGRLRVVARPLGRPAPDDDHARGHRDGIVATIWWRSTQWWPTRCRHPADV